MATATTPAKTQPKRDFAMMLSTDAAERIRAVLPPGINADRFVQTALSAYNRTPELQSCTPGSVIQSFIRAAEIGLMPNTAHGHAYLMVFNSKQKDGSWLKEAQLVIGYKGYVYMATKYGIFSAVDSRDVYARDHFEVIYDPEARMIHRPYMGDEDRGPLTHVYAYGRLKTGGVLFEVMSRRQVEEVRDATMKGDKLNPTWRNWFTEMAKKTVLRRFLKDQPCDDALAKALEYDAEVDAAATVVNAVEPLSRTSRSDALADRLAPRAIESSPVDDMLFDDPEVVDAKPQREPGDEG